MALSPLGSARAVTSHTAEMYRPPRRRLPSEAAREWLRNDRGEWDPSLTPELVEPLDTLASREYQGIVFVGPARTGKTFSLILAGVCYIVTCAPGDTLIVQMSQDTARDFSRTDLDRAIRHSPALAMRLSPRARDDNTYDKFFRSGMVVKLGWPSVTQLSSKTLQYVLLTAYDRPENKDDVDGEGPLLDLAVKRTETYMSRGKCLAESSPGGDYHEPTWRPTTPHEAPPARGILSLYNRGTRARLFWPCLHCGTYAQAAPGLEPFNLPVFEELEELVKTEDLAALADRYARVVCKACGGLHEQADRAAMKARALWVHEGQIIEGGRVVGERRRTQIASYWMGGVAAAYQRWDSIVGKYLQAVAVYARTKDESPLRATTNTDQGAPYLPRALANRRSSDDLLARVEEWPQRTVPEGVRFLTAAVDVQGHRFVVQVYGWGVGLECWLVDRFVLSASRRPEGEHFAGLDPAAYVEDWDVLVPEVVERRYRIDDRNSLTPMLVLCDSGGKAGVTEKAYEFWRRLRARNLGKRLMLVKGTGQPGAARAVMTWPDSRGRKDRTAGSKGDVPVWLVNVNVIKDGIAGDLKRDEPGPGYVHIPAWMDQGYFSEMTAESRTAKGWIKAAGAANEALDLHAYNRAAVIALQADSIDWTSPPVWAAPIAARATVNPTDIKAAPGRRMRSRGIT